MGNLIEHLYFSIFFILFSSIDISLTLFSHFNSVLILGKWLSLIDNCSLFLDFCGYLTYLPCVEPIGHYKTLNGACDSPWKAKKNIFNLWEIKFGQFYHFEGQIELRSQNLCTWRIGLRVWAFVVFWSCVVCNAFFLNELR